jgi:hypothetical protein
MFGIHTQNMTFSRKDVVGIIGIDGIVFVEKQVKVLCLTLLVKQHRYVGLIIPSKSPIRQKIPCGHLVDLSSDLVYLSVHIPLLLAS